MPVAPVVYVVGEVVGDYVQPPHAVYVVGPAHLAVLHPEPLVRVRLLRERVLVGVQHLIYRGVAVGVDDNLVTPPVQVQHHLVQLFLLVDQPRRLVRVAPVRRAQRSGDALYGTVRHYLTPRHAQPLVAVARLYRKVHFLEQVVVDEHVDAQLEVALVVHAVVQIVAVRAAAIAHRRVLYGRHPNLQVVLHGLDERAAQFVLCVGGNMPGHQVLRRHLAKHAVGVRRPRVAVHTPARGVRHFRMNFAQSHGVAVCHRHVAVTGGQEHRVVRGHLVEIGVRHEPHLRHGRLVESAGKYPLARRRILGALP